MGKALRVLMVEDNDDDAFFIIHELKEGGYEPQYRRVEKLPEALQLLEQEQWDILLSDYHLPGFTGMDVVKAVMDMEVDIPVIVISGAIGEDTAVETMRAGAHDYIMKGNLKRLCPAIERELEQMQVYKERKRAKQQLVESEEKFRQLTENIREVFWLYDCASATIVYFSPAFREVWARDPDEFMLDPFSLVDTLHPEDHDQIVSLLEGDAWTNFNADYRILRPDGEQRWISTRSFPIKDAEGKVFRVAGLSSDISLRKALEAERNMMVRALEQTADAVMITDQSGVIEYVNPAFEDVTGYSRDEVLGERPSIVASGMQDVEFYRNLWKTIANGLPYSDIFVNRRKNGDIYYESKTITPVRSEKGDITHYVSTGKDITKRLLEQERMHKIIHYDAVTGLANRILLVDRLDQAMMQARRLEQFVGVYSIGFDLVSLIGEFDEKELAEPLLKRVAERFREVCFERDTVARLGPNHFAVVARDVEDEEGIRTFAERLLDSFKQPIVAGDYELYLTPWIGVSIYPTHGEETEELLAKAEKTMAYVQQHGHHGYLVYSVETEGARGGHRLSS